MTDNIDTIVKGYGQPNPNSPASQKQARKKRDAAARFQPRPDLDRALAWRDAGDPRYDQLPAQTQVALGYYANDRRAAHAAQEEQS